MLLKLNFDFWGDYTPLRLPCIGQMKNPPLAIRCFKQVEGVFATMAKSIPPIKRIASQHLRKIAIDLNFQIPNGFIPKFVVRRADRF